MLGADSLAYLNVNTLKRILDEAGIPSCTACFSGDYPIDPPKESGTDVFSQPIITLTGK
jgi:amidophosphoribosyltransferase